MDSKYWESQSAAMLREYRTLQGFMDVARNEGTPEMVEATSAAMGAVWRLVEACDRRANQEARADAEDSGDPGAWDVEDTLAEQGLGEEERDRYYARQYSTGEGQSDTNHCDHRWEGRDGGSDYRCSRCGAWCSAEQADYDARSILADEPVQPTCPHGKPEFSHCDSCYLEACREERLGAYARQDALMSGETAEEPSFAVQERAVGNYDGEAYDFCYQRQRQITASGAGR